MRHLAIACIAALVLSSCTTTGTSKVDAALQKNLPKVCDTLQTSYIAFAAIAATGKIKQKTVDKAVAAYQGVRIVCANPNQATLASAVIQVTQAVIAVTAALKEAKAAEHG